MICLANHCDPQPSCCICFAAACCLEAHRRPGFASDAQCLESWARSQYMGTVPPIVQHSV